MQYLLLVILSALLPDIYIWQSFIRGSNLIFSILYWVPFIIMILAIILGALGYFHNWIFQVLFIIILCTILPKIAFTILSLIGKGGGMLTPYSIMTGNILGIIVAIIVFGGAAYGFAEGWKKITVKEVTVTSDQLPQSFDGYKIVHLSDFHIGTYRSSPETVTEIVKTVNESKPDMIVFTGDLVNSSPDELDMFMETLSDLKGKDGVFSIFGNHDYCEYRKYDTPDGQMKSIQNLKERQHDINWHLLLNENKLIRRGNDSIAIIGVENAGAPPFPSRENLPKAMHNLSNDIYKILLSHDPSHWRRKVLPDTDINLTLSGHTHAMQIKIGGFSPSILIQKEWGGLYSEGNRIMNVSTGTGSNIPFRLGAWPEINIIRLQSSR